MADAVYEGLFILDSNRYARDSAKTVARVEDLLREAGAEILVSRLWEERRLAYPIKGQRKGTYWLTYVRMNGENIGPFNRQCEIDDTILRQLLVKVHPKLVDAILAHASGVEESVEEEEESSEPAVAAKA